MENDRDFRDNLSAVLEGYKQKFQVDPVFKMADIVSNDVLFESYKEELFADVLDGTLESSFNHIDDGSGYFGLHADK